MKKLTFLILALFFTQIIKSQEPPPPMLMPGEHYTQLWSTYYDYQSNGSVKYVVRDPANSSNLCTILMGQPDSTASPEDERYIYYSYSSDYGNTWTDDVVVLVTGENYGFPCLTLSNGIPVIACNKNSGGITVYKDLFFGAYGFAEIPGVPANILCSHPQITGTANGNLVIVATTLQGIHRTTLNGATWLSWATLPGTNGPPSTYCVEANSNGIVGIFRIDLIGIDEFRSRSIKYYKSLDNGVTFDNGTTLFNYFIDGKDTLYANSIGGLQAVYKVNEPHLVFSVFKMTTTAFRNPNTIRFIKPKILHWSPLSGVRQIAGKFNIPNLADTITTSQMSPLCQPSIGLAADGKLVYSFTAFLKGNVQVVNNGTQINAGEILVGGSNDNGLSWSTPSNITNTPSIEEKHSSISKLYQNTYEGFYIRDLKAGGCVQHPEWGKAPVYGIFKRILPPFRINENNSE